MTEAEKIRLKKLNILSGMLPFLVTKKEIREAEDAFEKFGISMEVFMEETEKLLVDKLGLTDGVTIDDIYESFITEEYENLHK